MINRIREIIVFPEHCSLNRTYLNQVSNYNEYDFNDDSKWIIMDMILRDLKNDQSN